MLKILLSLVFFANSLFAIEYKGVVVGVTDGDTIKVLDENKSLHKIRLYGIDAPEKTQDFGYRAKQHLSNLVFSKTVKVRVQNKDRYGREVAIVFYKNEPSVNLEMIGDGYAWAYLQYIKKEFQGIYIEYENLAKKEKRGLWQNSDQTPPWNYRKAKKKRKAYA